MSSKVKRMRFISFVEAMASDDKEIRSFQQFCRAHQVPAMLTSNPYQHAMYLGKHLRNPEQLIGYVKCMTEYVEDPRTMLPQKLVLDEGEFLKAMQCVANWFAHEHQQLVISIKKAAKL